MIKKISKIQTERTAEQETNVWLEVLSHRNKLLLNSDWTQLADCGLTDECVYQWKSWRQQLKNVTRRNFSEPAHAEQAISILSRRMPINTYDDVLSEPSSEDMPFDAFKTKVIEYVDNAFNSCFTSGFLDNPVLVEEQFREAVDFINRNGDGVYPLISVTSELYGMGERAVANEFVTRKVELTKRMVNLKQKYFYFQGLVNSATDEVELDRIKLEVKTWILTST